MTVSSTSITAAEIVAAIAEVGIVPVIAIDEPDKADALADTLVRAGLPIAEITFRTPVAAEVIHAIRQAAPGLLVGAGTLLSATDVEHAAQAGARFGLAPGLVAATLNRADDCGLPFFPGVMTPSEIGFALSLGVTTMKFFPAGPAGGPAMLGALVAPHVHKRPRLIPTGGIGNDDIADWLAVPEVAAIGGSWIASRKDIAQGNWEAIYEHARKAVATVRAIRGAAS